MHVFSVSLRRAVSSGSKHSTFHPLLPIYPPPPTVLNSLSYSLPRRSIFQNTNYVLTTHLVPAAYLRATSPAPPPPAAAARTSSKEERRVRNAERSAWVSAQAEGPHTPHERVLWSAVNRYVRRDVSDGRGNGRTLFLAHANGFPKEVGECLTQHALWSLDWLLFVDLGAGFVGFFSDSKQCCDRRDMGLGGHSPRRIFRAQRIHPASCLCVPRSSISW